jgi:hypothetical protein
MVGNLAGLALRLDKFDYDANATCACTARCPSRRSNRHGTAAASTVSSTGGACYLDRSPVLGLDRLSAAAPASPKGGAAHTANYGIASARFGTKARRAIAASNIERAADGHATRSTKGTIANTS